jgi:alpha-beta hydrolase superfamily lysophospholipase
MKLAQKLVINYFRAKLNMLSVISKKWAAKSALDLFCTPLRKPRKKFPAIFNDAEILRFHLQGQHITGYRWNQKGTKKVLVVHGFESSSRNFDRYISSLIKKGYEVMAFDAPAHGESGGKRINLPLYVEAVQTIYEQYGPIECFVAHSYGGLIVAHFLENVMHDESMKAVLIAPATETVSTIDSFFRFLHLDEGVRKEFDKLIYDRSGYWPDHFSIRRAMHNIRAQVLWFHDMEDDMTPVDDALKVEEDRHPNVLFRITKGLGHRKIYRDNKVVKETIDFL